MQDKLIMISPDGSNVETARKMACDVVDAIMEHFLSLRKHDVFPSPIELHLTDHPSSWDDILQYIRNVLTRSMQVAHPRFFGHMDSGPLFVSVLADWVTSALNQNMLSNELSPFATEIEEEIIQWFCGLCGYKHGEGTLVSGGTMANFTALLLALHQNTNGRFRHEGVWSLPGRPVIFTSDQAHYSITKAAAGAGLGEQSVMKVKTDHRYRMNVHELECALLRAKEAGQLPLMVVATAGTTSTGSVDPIADIATVCQRSGVWLHVDAAHGGGALFSSIARKKLFGIERADSITIDPHKWLMQPKGMGMIFTRHVGLLSSLFQADAPYLNRYTSQPVLSRGSMTFQGSRRFDALRLWITRKYLGDEQFGALIDASMWQVHEWAKLLRVNGNFELAHDPDLNLLCFQYRPKHMPEHGLDNLNEEIQMRLMYSGWGFVSLTTLNGHRWMRSVFLNPSTTTGDMLAVINEMERLSQQLQ